MGTVVKAINKKENKRALKAYKYTEEGQKSIYTYANNSAHAMQLFAEKLEKRVDKTKIEEVDLDKEFPNKKEKRPRNNSNAN